MNAAGIKADDVLRRLDRRLIDAAGVLLEYVHTEADADAGDAAAILLPRLLIHARDTNSQSATWLILTAVAARFPTADQVRRVQRSMRFHELDVVERDLLVSAWQAPPVGRLDLDMRIVTDPLIDVDTSARSDYQSGIHRVVRETMSRWAHAHTIELAVWDDTYAIYRSAAPQESGRVFRYGVEDSAGAAYTPEMLVPWNTVVVLPDVPIGRPSEVLAGVALCSGNRVSAIGYDLIPITSAETRPLQDSAAAGEWLVPLKAADRIAAISTSAKAEFEGFTQMLEAQGLSGPVVREVRLTGNAAPSWFRPTPQPDRMSPRIVLSGTREPHKNHRALLYAAERLWAEGLEFEVRLVGGNGWTDEHVGATISRLKHDGRALVDLGRVSEETLWRELAGADVVAFASLHEGYGLPVVEALAVGTPVLTASYGSQAEIASEGGCLTADPHDDESLVAALRRLVTEPELRDELAREARERPRATWDDYAAELWQFLVTRDDQEAR